MMSYIRLFRFRPGLRKEPTSDGRSASDVRNQANSCTNSSISRKADGNNLLNHSRIPGQGRWHVIHAFGVIHPMTHNPHEFQWRCLACDKLMAIGHGHSLDDSDDIHVCLDCWDTIPAGHRVFLRGVMPLLLNTQKDRGPSGLGDLFGRN